jgi:RNA polymerase sigma-70 factor (family 1)
MQHIATASSLQGDCLHMGMIAENINELQRRVALYDDEPAYKQIFFIYFSPLLRFAQTFIGDRQHAEEIVSDVMMKIWEKRRNLTSITNLRVYLYISTKNTALNFINRQKNIDILSLEQLNIDFPSNYLNPEQMMITAEMLRLINAAINALPPRCKLVFKLVKEDGLPYREVADILNISIKTIDNQLAIALRKISEALSVQLDLKLEY